MSFPMICTIWVTVIWVDYQKSRNAKQILNLPSIYRAMHTSISKNQDRIFEYEPKIAPLALMRGADS